MMSVYIKDFLCVSVLGVGFNLGIDAQRDQEGYYVVASVSKHGHACSRIGCLRCTDYSSQAKRLLGLGKGVSKYLTR